MAVNLLKKNSLALVASMLLAGHVQATELLNSSYDVSRELFAALNPPFEQQWAKDNGGDKLTIKQSHAGSSKQALAILQGLKADVVTYNQVTDVQILHDKGKLIPADWQTRLPNNSSPFYSKRRVTHVTPIWRHGVQRIKLTVATKPKPNSL